MNAINPMQRSSIDTAAITLARAYSSDPIFLWVLPVPATRPPHFEDLTAFRLSTVCVTEPHWYLMVVGVDPALPNRGVSSALVKEGLRQADQSGCPCYLETSEQRNLAFYERLGFVVLEQATLGTGGPRA